MDKKEKDPKTTELDNSDDNIDLNSDDTEQAEEFVEELTQETEVQDTQNQTDDALSADSVTSGGGSETTDSSQSEQAIDLDKSKTIEEAIVENSKVESDVFESDSEVDALVDDIVRTESDESIAEADAKVAALELAKNKKTFGQKLKSAFRSWWDNRPIRYGTLAGLFILIVATILLPTTRYTVLNTFGVRVSSSLIVIDSKTRLPLKNINVKLQNEVGKTDEEGKLAFKNLKLGKSQLLIAKRGYAETDKQIVLGWGSNPIGEQEIVATGTQIVFVLSDWQSNEKVINAEAVAGENNAISDDEGKITLTIGEESISDVEVMITADGYRSETLSNDQLIEGEVKIKMVPERKHVFVSNRSGSYDVYKIDLDKKNESILLSSTGKERDAPVVVQHPTRNITALISSRDGEVNNDGYVLDGLYLIEANSAEVKRITRSEQLQIIGWSGDSLVYWQVIEGTSRANPQRSKLISYNERTSERIELASANYFNDVKLVGDVVYYSISSYAVPQSQAKLYSIKTDGKDGKKLLDSQVWSIYRNAYNKLLFNAEDQKWYEKTNDEDLVEVAKQPAPESINYKDSTDRSKTAWVEVRDGKGVLLASDTNEIQEKQILTMPGLSEVLYWVNNRSLVLRVISNSETADYFVDIENKEPLKISDVTASKNLYY
jgi:hypothetical protein